MDRYVIRHPRTGTDYPQGNQMIAFSSNPIGNNNNMISPANNVYYRSYGAEHSNVLHTPNLGYVGYSYATAPQPVTSITNLPPGQSQMLSGIDPRYLASYSNNSAQFLVGEQPLYGQNSTDNVNFGINYQNQNFVGPDINDMKTIAQQVTPVEQSIRAQDFTNNPSFGMEYQNQNFVGPDRKYNQRTMATPQRGAFAGRPRTEIVQPKQLNVNDNNSFKGDGKQEPEINSCALPSYTKPAEKDSTKRSGQSKTARWNKLEVLYKRGLLVFSGSVENVLKWHKPLQEIGVLALYEVIAKCVSVRPEKSCAKNLVLRDESGPAIQVVYYEIDFQLPELMLPCTIRVVGKMMPGTCRLQAFKVCRATGDDVALLPRRAAVSAHHINKLSIEYGNN